MPLHPKKVSLQSSAGSVGMSWERSIAWKRPERQKAGKIFKHQLYSVLKITNRELEKVIQTLSPTPGPPEESFLPIRLQTSRLGSQTGSPALARPDTAAFRETKGRMI